MKVIHKSCAYALSIMALGAISGVAGAVSFRESEPNDSKATADAVVLGPHFTSIRGNSTSAVHGGLDNFRIWTSRSEPGIYLHTLTLSSATPGHDATIRGRNQLGVAAGPWTGSVGRLGTADPTAQTQYIPPVSTLRTNSWFGFGRPEAIYYRVTGTAATTADYVATFSQTRVTPTNIGSFQAGRIAISTLGQKAGQSKLDTDLWVYDANFNPIFGFGNDDASVHGGAPYASVLSWLQRDFSPGVYYLALAQFNLSNSMGSPSDDGFRTGIMLDYPGSVLSSSTTWATERVSFQVIDSLGTHSFWGDRIAPHGINWYSMTVVPEPATMLALGMGSLLLAGRRLRKKR